MSNAEKKPKKKKRKGKNPWEGRIYIGRDEETGKQLFHWVGRFATKRERDEAVKAERDRLADEVAEELPTCDEYVDRFVADAWRRLKRSTVESYEERLERFREDFAGWRLDLRRREAKDWVNGEGRWEDEGPVSSGEVQVVVTLYNHAIDEDDLRLEHNPFRKLGKRTRGRSEEAPPTPEQFQKLLDACAVLGEYAPMMRALMLFAAFTLMRPSELYPLERTDLDFKAMRMRKARRLYRGELDEPKTGPVTIALTPPARDAVLGLANEGPLVFCSKTGKRLSQSALSGYWAQVCAAAGLHFDFYLATKHYGVHYMWTKLRMSRRAIAAQAGWSLRTVDKMLSIYGHGDVGALEEVDAAFERAEAPRLRKIEGGKNA